MSLPLDIRSFLLEQLPHGTRKKVAEKLGVSTATLRRFLKGETKNSRIEKHLFLVYSELKRERVEQSKEIAELLLE